MSPVLTYDDNTSGIFCVMPGCDQGFSLLMDATYSLPIKRTFNQAFKQNTNNNGVPTYYNQNY